MQGKANMLFDVEFLVPEVEGTLGLLEARLPLPSFFRLGAPDATVPDSPCPPSLSEATAAGQSPPFYPDCSFLEGEKNGRGHTPGCGLGKAGASG